MEYTIGNVYKLRKRETTNEEGALQLVPEPYHKFVQFHH